MSDVLFRIVVEDAGVNAALKANRDVVKQTNEALKGVTAGTAKYVELAQTLIKTKVEAAQLRDRQRELNKEFQALRVPTDSLAGLRLEYGKLTSQIANLSRVERESQFGKSLIRNAANVKKEIDGIEQSVGRFTGNVGNYRDALNGFANLVKSSLGPLAALAAAQKIIQNNAKISDLVADVAKAADISIESVNRLADTLEKRLTRTNLADQLSIAEIGGKLGVAEKDLFSFVEAIDVVNVALGDQFGGSVEATTDVLGKLRNVLTDIRTDNIGKDIQNIGNALNYLEAQGAASAGTIADFAGRIAGAGRNLGVTSGQIIGVSATLDELGVNAERGSSAYVRILQRVAASPAAFAKAAGVSAKDFTKLVNEDIAGAVNLFLAKINDQDLSNTELQKVLKALKLEGVGTAETVGKLGQNLALLNKRTAEAGKALQETGSIQQEFEKKNQTLGAAVQNLTNAFVNLTTDSGLANFLRGVINEVTNLINLFRSENTVLQDQQKEFNALIGVLQDTTTSEAERNRVIAELRKQYPDYLKFVNNDTAGQIDLNATLDQGNKLFEARALLQATEEKRAALIKQQIDAETELTAALSEQQKIRQSGTGGQRVGIIRNEAQDQSANPLTQTELAAKRVQALRETISTAKKSLDELRIQTNETSLRVFNKSLDDLAGKVDTINLSGEAATDGSAPTGKSNLPGKVAKTKEEVEAAAGSIEFLREKIQKLTEAIDKSPEDAKLLSPLLLQLGQAEFQLAELQARLDKLRSPKPALTEDQAIFDALGLPVPTGRGTTLGQRERDINFTGDAQVQEEEARKAKLDELDAIYDKRHRDRLDKSIEDEKKKREELKDSIIRAGEQLADAVFQIQANRIDNEENKALEALDKEYEQKIQAAQGNAAAVTQLEKEQAQKREQIEKEAAEKRKSIAKTEAVIQGAVAVVEALPNLVLAALATVTTLAQIAIIDSQQFSEGGFTGPGSNYRDSTGQRVAGSYMKGPTRIVYHENEYFAPTDQLNRYPELFQWLDRDRSTKGRSFAGGGFTDFVPQVFGQPQQASQTIITTGFSREQEDRIAATIAKEVRLAVRAGAREGTSEGASDADRLRERQQRASEQRLI